MDWKNNKRIQIAIGIAIIVLAMRWLFAPTLQDAALAYSAEPPADGDVADPLTGWALVWPVVELALAMLAGLGAYAINLGDWIWSQIQGGSSSEGQLAVTAASPDRIHRELIQAIASGNESARMRLEPMVRGPEAIREVSAALAEGEFDAAQERIAELVALASMAEDSEAAQ